MKKKTIGMLCLANVVSMALAPAAKACGQSQRVVYVARSHAVATSRIVRTVPVVRAMPVIRTTTVVSRPAVSMAVRQPAALDVKSKVADIEQRSIVTAKVRFAGNDQGEVTIRSGKIELQCEILEWSSNRVKFQLPELPILHDAAVTLTIFKASGTVSRKMQATLLADADFKIEPAPFGTMTDGSTATVR